jgi:hypothetical protein
MDDLEIFCLLLFFFFVYGDFIVIFMLLGIPGIVFITHDKMGNGQRHAKRRTAVLTVN